MENTIKVHVNGNLITDTVAPGMAGYFKNIHFRNMNVFRKAKTMADRVVKTFDTAFCSRNVNGVKDSEGMLDAFIRFISEEDPVHFYGYVEKDYLGQDVEDF